MPCASTTTMIDAWQEFTAVGDARACDSCAYRARRRSEATPSASLSSTLWHGLLLTPISLGRKECAGVVAGVSHRLRTMLVRKHGPFPGVYGGSDFLQTHRLTGT